ncbi:MAG TPA: regulatory protein RecX [Blastocatellia bacterium]|nr:regulatory protein RecX [Blastocatellia bacterium]
MATTLYQQVMERAFKLLSYKPRSVAELRERLLAKPAVDESTVDQVLSRLTELGYLNDQQFAINYASSRLNIKPLGRTRLRRDLERKKLPSRAVEQALDEAYTERNEDELIDRVIDKRLRLKGPPGSREETKKLFDYLIRRGFGYDLVLRKIRQIAKDVDEFDGNG